MIYVESPLEIMFTKITNSVSPTWLRPVTTIPKLVLEWFVCATASFLVNVL